MVFFKEKIARLREGKDLGITKTDSRFHQYTNYYLSTSDDGKIAKVNLKKRDMFKHFPEVQSIAMLEYVKKKGLKLKKEGDYIAMLHATRQ